MIHLEILLCKPICDFIIHLTSSEVILYFIIKYNYIEYTCIAQNYNHTLLALSEFICCFDFYLSENFITINYAVIER